MPDLFDMRLRSLRRDRAARRGAELFLFERTFGDCLERIRLQQRRFRNALLIGCPDPGWPERLKAVAGCVEMRDPGLLFARGTPIVEDASELPDDAYDLVIAIGTLDTVNDLPSALRRIRNGMGAGGLFIAALSGGDTMPKLRAAMRAADAVSGIAAPHVHPRIEASMLAPLLADAGFIDAVVDVDRVAVSYRSLTRLVQDLRAMGTTNILGARPRFIGKAALAAAESAFADAGDGARTREIFEILHIAAWRWKEG